MSQSKQSKKADKSLSNLLGVIREHIKGRGYSPLTFEELCSKLNIAEQHWPALKQTLHQLTTEGVIGIKDKRYLSAQATSDIVRGSLIVHPRGFAFLQPEKGSPFTQDIFIPKHLTLNAINGDTVEAQVNKASLKSEKGPEGKIVAILERTRTHVAGIVYAINDLGGWAHAPLLGEKRPVCIEDSTLEEPLKIGDRVVMAILEWGDGDTPSLATVSHRIGNIEDPECDIPAAIEEYSLRSHFPTLAVEEAHSFGRIVKQKELIHREDLRDQETFTIDPETAKDFDDALSLTVDEEGLYHLSVHIADVSHYVTPGSAIDHEAKLRCNSTYFPGTCLPMLPHELSNELCSLRANVNRLTVSVFMKLDNEGTLVSYRIARTVIKSSKRFTYEEAKAVLDGKKKSKHAPTLHRMVELCRLLKKQRYKRGSLEFSLPELVIAVDERGVPFGTKRIEYDVTHQLVEEFMLKANEVVARHLFTSGKRLTYRVHEEPSLDNMREFALICRAFGFKVPVEPSPSDLQQLFDQSANTPFAEYLANAYIRRMRLACYSAENIGHFGLSLEHYCHFTSPIRRYVDLVIHRNLFDHPYTLPELEAIALECSEKERLSAKAEQNVLSLKKLRWLVELKKREPKRQYSAIITRVKNFGISFEVPEVMIEGFLHVSELDGDYYTYNSTSMQLVGEHSGGTFQIADQITVQPGEINLITMESRWHLVAAQNSTKTYQSRKHPSDEGGKGGKREARERKRPKEKRSKGKRQK